MASCSLCRRNHLFFRSIWISHTDVIQDALLEQERILKYEADLIHQRIQRNVPNVNAADLNTSVRHIIKPGDQAGMVLLPPPEGPTMAVTLPDPQRKKHETGP